jgi:hypothetical protein
MAITWEISVVERAGVSTRPSLAFSSLGQAGIAYYSSLLQALRFAASSSAGWASTTVETCPDDCFPSFAFQSPRHPAISYNIGGTLKYAIHRGGWDIQTVTAQGQEGLSSSLAFDASDRPCISYYDSAEKALKYATVVPSGWIIQTVDEEAGAGSSSCLAFNASGQPAIAYAATSTSERTPNAPEIRYAVLNGTTWVREKGWPGALNTGSAPPPGSFGLANVSLAFSPHRYNGMDPLPIIGFSFTDLSLRPWGKLILMRNRVLWEQFLSLMGNSTPSDGGCLASNVNLNETVIAYHDDYFEAIKYAVEGFDPEPRSTVEKAGKTPAGQFIGPFGLPSLAFKFGDQPAISYYDSANADGAGGFIKYAIGTRSLSLLDILTAFIRRLGWHPGRP